MSILQSWWRLFLTFPLSGDIQKALAVLRLSDIRLRGTSLDHAQQGAPSEWKRESKVVKKHWWFAGWARRRCSCNTQLPCCVLAAWWGVTANCFPITSPVILSTHLELWGAEWKRKRDSLAQWEQECWERCFHISVAVGVAVVVLHTGVGLGTQCWQPWGSTACKCLCCSGMPKVLIFVLLWKG